MKGIVILCAVILVVVILLIHKSSTNMHIIWHTFDNGYRIAEIYNALSANECDALCELSRNTGMQDSYIWGTMSNEVQNNYRKSKQVWLPCESSSITAKMCRLSEILTNIPKQNQEHIQVVHYDAGGRFDDHYDVCTSKDTHSCHTMNSGAGERKATLLFYLNDSFQGGETVFPDIGFVSTPKKGKAILFYNTNSNEELLWQSKHRGNPVEGGQKWIATIWSHPFPYPKI